MECVTRKTNYILSLISISLSFASFESHSERTAVSEVGMTDVRVR